MLHMKITNKDGNNNWTSCITFTGYLKPQIILDGDTF